MASNSLSFPHVGITGVHHYTQTQCFTLLDSSDPEIFPDGSWEPEV